jgi:hypothetical protein
LAWNNKNPKGKDTEELKKYGIDLGMQRILRTRVYKWKDNKFQNIGQLFKSSYDKDK